MSETRVPGYSHLCLAAMRVVPYSGSEELYLEQCANRTYVGFEDELQQLINSHTGRSMYQLAAGFRRISREYGWRIPQNIIDQLNRRWPDIDWARELSDISYNES